MFKLVSKRCLWSRWGTNIVAYQNMHNEFNTIHYDNGGTNDGYAIPIGVRITNPYYMWVPEISMRVWRV